MKTQETTTKQDSKQLESEGNTFMKAPAFGLTAGGESPSDGNGTAIQRQEAGGVKEGEPKKNILLTETFGGAAYVQGMTCLGVQTFTDAGLGGQTNRYVLTGTKEQWATILSYTDDDEIFTSYVSGFLLACTNPAELETSGGITMRKNNDFQLLRVPTAYEKLQFLKALYGVDINNGSLDLVNTYMEDSPMTGPGLDKTSGLLGDFIKQNQHLLIAYKSKQTTGQHFKAGGLETLADQGTRDSYNPAVVQAMIQNAYATAVSTTKLILAGSFKNAPPASVTASINAVDMVINSAIIINSTLDAYAARISELADGVGEIFDEVWGQLPIPSMPGADIIVSHAKSNIKGKLVRSAVALPSAESMKQGFIDDYGSILKQSCTELADTFFEEIDGEKLTGYYRDLVEIFRGNIQV